MDDFLTRLYHEELEKTASRTNLAVFDNFSASELENFLGLDKLAVGGPVEPEVSPAMKKSIEARETKGKDAEKRIAAGNSHSETAPDRNIAPITPGQSVPERNFVQPGRSIPENTLAVKQASFQWADSMGRYLAQMNKMAAPAPTTMEDVAAKKAALRSRAQATKGAAEATKAVTEAAAPAAEKATESAVAAEAKNVAGKTTGAIGGFFKKHPSVGWAGIPLAAGGLAYGAYRLGKSNQKTAAAMMGIKLAHQLPGYMRQGLIEATANQMCKSAGVGALRKALAEGGGSILKKPTSIYLGGKGVGGGKGISAIRNAAMGSQTGAVASSGLAGERRTALPNIFNRPPKKSPVPFGQTSEAKSAAELLKDKIKSGDFAKVKMPK